MKSLSAENRRWADAWPDLGFVEAAAGKVLLCHGSPDRTNEFLYESELDDGRLNTWLDQFQAAGLVCTHSGLPWIHRLADHRFAVNCGVIGKPDNDGDPAVHYALLEMSQSVVAFITIERVEYDFRQWADQLTREGVDKVFVSPLRTGVWTCGASGLPTRERKSRPRTVGSVVESAC